MPEKCNMGLQSFGTVFLCTARTIISISPSYLKVRSTCWNTGKMLSPCSFWCIVASFYPFASTYLILICKLKASRCNENAPGLSIVLEFVTMLPQGKRSDPLTKPAAPHRLTIIVNPIPNMGCLSIIFHLQ